MKKTNQIEYIVKGFANSKRIEILIVLESNPELTVGDITKIIKLSFNSTSSHLLKMMATGLVMKRKKGLEVRHALTEKGKNVVKFFSEI